MQGLPSESIQQHHTHTGSLKQVHSRILPSQAVYFGPLLSQSMVGWWNGFVPLLKDTGIGSIIFVMLPCISCKNEVSWDRIYLLDMLFGFCFVFPFLLWGVVFVHERGWKRCVCPPIQGSIQNGIVSLSAVSLGMVHTGEQQCSPKSQAGLVEPFSGCGQAC